MIKQLKDILDFEDIFDNNDLCITSKFSTLSSDDYNAYLIQFINTNNDDLTLEYLGNRLDKILSPLYERLINRYIEEAHETLSEAVKLSNVKLISVIENKFLFNWNKLAEGFFADYNPIHNYDMIENEDTDLNTKTNTETKTTQKYAGFNSPITLPVATETEGEGETSGTQEFNNSARELTRKGNIGVTTTAQMLTQEFELRKRTLLDKIYNDIDSVLFLDYYI